MANRTKKQKQEEEPTVSTGQTAGLPLTDRILIRIQKEGASGVYIDNLLDEFLEKDDDIDSKRKLGDAFDILKKGKFIIERERYRRWWILGTKGRTRLKEVEKMQATAITADWEYITFEVEAKMLEERLNDERKNGLMLVALTVAEGGAYLAVFHAPRGTREKRAVTERRREK